MYKISAGCSPEINPKNINYPKTILLAKRTKKNCLVPQHNKKKKRNHKKHKKITA